MLPGATTTVNVVISGCVGQEARSSVYAHAGVNLLLLAAVQRAAEAVKAAQARLQHAQAASAAAAAAAAAAPLQLEPLRRGARPAPRGCPALQPVPAPRPDAVRASCNGPTCLT